MSLHPQQNPAGEVDLGGPTRVVVRGIQRDQVGGVREDFVLEQGQDAARVVVGKAGVSLSPSRYPKVDDSPRHTTRKTDGGFAGVKSGPRKPRLLTDAVSPDACPAAPCNWYKGGNL
jgi:hypothetical protein